MGWLLIHPCAIPKTSGKDQCYKFHLPKHDHVTIFLDLEAGSKPTVVRLSAKGVSNKELARLDLGRLGIIPLFFRSTLFVMKSALEKSESSSEIRYCDAWEARSLQPEPGHVGGAGVETQM